ncbi:MAG: YbjN domain-containing protein [Acidimicrobiales bacterium]
MIDAARQPSSPEELTRLGNLIAAWAAEQLADNPAVLSVEHDANERRWILRLEGDEKGVFAVWFTLGQRSLAYETYLLPAPEENPAAFYEHLLRRNETLKGVAFTIGAEEALYLKGRCPNAWVDADELDRILGTLYEAVERCFRTALRVGFGSRLPPHLQA